MKSKGHVPVRQCIACRERRPARDMFQFKCVDEQAVLVKPGEWLPGRGCYICRSEACIDRALHKHSFPRAMRRSDVIPPSREELVRRIEKEG